MKNTKKIYVVGNATYYANFIKNHELVFDLKEANIVLFTGGEDVDPSLYGCEKHSTTYSNLERDLYEKEIFEQVSDNQLVIGICRGSQFCCIMNGGILIQHCENHGIRGTHSIYEPSTNRLYDITSTHHQMQYPFNVPFATILMHSVQRRSTRYYGDQVDRTMISVEPEIVLYTNPKKPVCLAIQGHPEYMPSESPIVVRLNEMIDSLCK